MQNLFSADGHVSADEFSKWAEISAREFYDGDLEVDDFEHADIRLEKGLSYPVSLTRLSARCDTSYRRSWPHIRTNKVGFRTIWFVRKGTLRIIRSQGNCEVRAGQLGVIDSSAPFQVKSMCDADGEYESLQLIVPAPMFLMHLQEADKMRTPVALDTPRGEAIQNMLDLLVANGERLSRRAAIHMAEGLLVTLADHLEGQNAGISRRQQLVAKRLSDIENYIMMNLTDPDLSFERVASKCGISPRYLCYVLKANRTSFSRLLWHNRLGKAKDLLLSAATRDYPIHEIAYMSGFKSAAHFSRMFKATFGCPPRSFRKGSGPAEMVETDKERMALALGFSGSA